MTARALIPPSESTAFNDERRQVAFGRVGDRAQNREWGALFERILTGDQAFHVDARRSGGATQFRLGGGGQNRSIGGGQTLDNDARSGARPVAAPATMSTASSALNGALIRDDFRAENEVAGIGAADQARRTDPS